MLHLLLSLGLVLAPSPNQDLEGRIAALEAAVDAGRPVPTARALARTGAIEDPRVVKACFRALDSPAARVRVAAVEALRFNAHSGALQVLHNQLRKSAAATADPAVEVAVVRAIGQHASDKSLPLLTRDPLDPKRPVLGRARLLALGRIGTRDAVDALVELGLGVPETQRLLFADDLRLALQRATGADRGLDLEAWSTWWARARATFEPAATRDAAPRLCTLEWNAYWTSRTPLATPAPAPIALRVVDPRDGATGRAVEAGAKAPAKQASAGKRGGTTAEGPNSSGKGARPKGAGKAQGAGKANAAGAKKAAGPKAGAGSPKGANAKTKPGAGKGGAGTKGPGDTGSQDGAGGR